MRAFWIFLIIFWAIIIYFPEIIAYLLWWLLVFIWFNILWFGIISKKKNPTENYVKFWNYKIFR